MHVTFSCLWDGTYRVAVLFGSDRNGLRRQTIGELHFAHAEDFAWFIRLIRSGEFETLIETKKE